MRINTAETAKEIIELISITGESVYTLKRQDGDIARILEGLEADEITNLVRELAYMAKYYLSKLRCAS